jgi:hypothetical protein
MKTFFFFMILLLSSAAVQAQNELRQHNFSAAEVQVNQTVVKFFDALSELNAEKLKLHATKDLMLLENGEVWNTDSLVNYLEPMKKLKITRINKFKFITTEISGNTAWTAYYNRADMKRGEREIAQDWLESAILIKAEGLWIIKTLHSTVIKPKAK